MIKFIIQLVSLITLIGLLTYAWANQSQHVDSVFPPRGNGLSISNQ